MSRSTTHQPRTRAGQDRLDDYAPVAGEEFLGNVFPVTIHESTTVEHTLTTAVMALMDPDGTLKNAVICTKEVVRVVKSETIQIITDLWPEEQERSYNNLREPDLYDDEQAIWVSNKGTVSVDINKLRGFNAYVRAAGLAPGGCAVKINAFGPRDSQWDFIKEVCGR